MDFYEPTNLVLSGAILRQQFRIEDHLAALAATQAQQIEAQQKEDAARQLLFEVTTEVRAIMPEVAQHPPLALWRALACGHRLQLAGIGPVTFRAIADKEYYQSTIQSLSAVASAVADVIGSEEANRVAKLFFVHQTTYLHRRAVAWLGAQEALRKCGMRSMPRARWWIIGGLLLGAYVGKRLLDGIAAYLDSIPSLRQTPVEPLVGGWVVFVILIAIVGGWLGFRRKAKYAKAIEEARTLVAPTGGTIQEEATRKQVEEIAVGVVADLRQRGLPVPATVKEARGALANALELITSESARQNLVLPAV